MDNYIGKTYDLERIPGVRADGTALEIGVEWRVEDIDPAYLETVANELLPEAVEAGRIILKTLVAA